MAQRGDELTEKEEEDIEAFVKRFNRKSRMLSKYASLNSEQKDKLNNKAENYMQQAEESDSIKTAQKYKYRAAEINSGIPAIEEAINEYLSKYAISIKIKTVHDAFMKKVNERNMVNNCEAEWAASKEKFDEIKKEIEEKRAKCNHEQKLLEFRNKIAEIQLDVSILNDVRNNVLLKINEIRDKYQKDQVPKKEAESIVRDFISNIEGIEKYAKDEIGNAVNNTIVKSCQSILEEYKEYIKELNNEGLLNIGSFDIQQTTLFNSYDINSVGDLINNSSYINTKREKTGEKTFENSGIRAGIARFFGVSVFLGKAAYRTIDVYEDKEYVKIMDLITDQISENEFSFKKQVNQIIKISQNQVEDIKDATLEKLKYLDRLVIEMFDEIDKMTESQEELSKRVRANAEKTRWIKDFVIKVEGLLTV